MVLERREEGEREKERLLGVPLWKVEVGEDRVHKVLD
jgi:hypothetical protein